MKASDIPAGMTAEQLEEAIAVGLADVDAGRLHSLEEVCDELHARYTAMERARKTSRRRSPKKT